MITDTEISPPSLNFLKRSTTHFGILQHSKYDAPDWKHGYCLDDNGRALVLLSRMIKAGVGDTTENKRLAALYLGYISHCSQVDGKMHNFISHDQKFLDKIGSDDSFGRAIWGLGECSSLGEHGLANLANELIIKHINYVFSLKSSRAIAYAILGVMACSADFITELNISKELDSVKDRMIENYKASSSPEWQWFETSLTYSNALLALSLLNLSVLLKDKEAAAVALTTMEWLLAQTEIKKHGKIIACPIGHNGWFIKGKKRAIYGQQPIDVTITILALSRAFVLTKDKKWLVHIDRWYRWFTGENTEGLVMINQEMGWCYDGLYQDRVNPNHGAETVIMYLLAQLEIYQLRKS